MLGIWVVGLLGCWIDGAVGCWAVRLFSLTYSHLTAKKKLLCRRDIQYNYLKILFI